MKMENKNKLNINLAASATVGQVVPLSTSVANMKIYNKCITTGRFSTHRYSKSTPSLSTLAMSTRAIIAYPDRWTRSV